MDSDVRDVTVRTFDNLLDGDELWVSSKGTKSLDKKYTPYLMAVIADTMIEEEVCLNLKMDRNFLVVSIDRNADVLTVKNSLKNSITWPQVSIMIQIQVFQMMKLKQKCI